jgi:uncharacterized protein YneR
LFTVTKRAARFYKKEMELENGEAIRLFVRYGGKAGKNGFSVGVERSGKLDRHCDQTIIDGITFFADPDDRWFLDTVTLDADENLEDVVLTYAND